MTPGPDKIFACPDCAKLFAVHTIGSGNTFGAVWWTDGKCEAPMLPESVVIGECPHCGLALWLEDAKEVGEVERWGPAIAAAPPTPPEWSNTPPLRLATEAVIGQTIARESKTNRDRLAYLHRKLWWLHNDPHREADPRHIDDPVAPRPAAFADNLRQLLALLDLHSVDDRITAAEVHRELGEFEHASLLLQHEFPNDYLPAVERIRELAARKDPGVAPFAG